MRGAMGAEVGAGHGEISDAMKETHIISMEEAPQCIKLLMQG